MPIRESIMDHEVLGRERRRGIELGREEGREETLHLVLRQVEESFGPISSHQRALIERLAPQHLQEFGVLLLRASSLDQLLNSI
jgi:hypothetical protein